MKHLAVLCLAALVAACSSAPTAPIVRTKVDPTISVANNSPDILHLTWLDQRSGVVSITPIAAGATVCIRDTVPTTDSIKIVVYDSTFAAGGGPWSETYSPWFMAGQPFTSVNGHYVSDYWTASAAPGASGNQPAVLEEIADSLPPC